MSVDQSKFEQIINRLRGLDRTLNNSIDHTAHTNRTYPTVAKRYNEIINWLNEESKKDPILGNANLNFSTFDEIDFEEFGNYKPAIRLQTTIKLLIDELRHIGKIEGPNESESRILKEKKPPVDSISRGMSVQQVIVSYSEKAGRALETPQWQVGVSIVLGIVESVLTKNAWIVIGCLLAWIFFIWGLKICKTGPKTFFVLTIFFTVSLCALGSWGEQMVIQKSKEDTVDGISKKINTDQLAEVSKPKINNGGFEAYFKEWIRYENGKLFLSDTIMSSDPVVATAPTIRPITPQPPGIFNVIDKVGNDLTNGLYINCPLKPAPNMYPHLKQEIDNLRPGAFYKIKFWIQRYENSKINKDSLYIALGIPWGKENKVFYENDRNDGWNEIIIKNPSRKKETLYVVINDITSGLTLDDISIEGPIEAYPRPVK